MIDIEKGDEVAWPWGRSLAMGQVVDIHQTKYSIESKGKIITRNGTEADPAVVVVGVNGSLIIKLAHEVKVINKGKSNEQ